jgi:hypothetical protein
MDRGDMYRGFGVENGRKQIDGKNMLKRMYNIKTNLLDVVCGALTGLIYSMM